MGQNLSTLVRAQASCSWNYGHEVLQDYGVMPRRGMACARWRPHISEQRYVVLKRSVTQIVHI